MFYVGYKHTREARQKISYSHRGEKKSEEHRQKLSKALKGIKRAPWSEERRQKLSQTRRGIRFTREHRQKLSESHKGNIRTEKTKRKISEAHIKMIMSSDIHQAPRSKKGYYFSLKNHAIIYYASSYELIAFQILEQMSIVNRYQRCPFSVPYMTNDGCTHRYVPDILVEYQDGKQEVIEVKPQWALDYGLGLDKFQAAKLYCKEKDIKFSVWTENNLSDKKEKKEMI